MEHSDQSDKEDSEKKQVARKKENWELWYPQSQEKEIFPGRFKYEE
jgi:hypothetical protein